MIRRSFLTDLILALLALFGLHPARKPAPRPARKSTRVGPRDLAEGRYRVTWPGAPATLNCRTFEVESSCGQILRLVLKDLRGHPFALTALLAAARIASGIPVLVRLSEDKRGRLTFMVCEFMHLVAVAPTTEAGGIATVASATFERCVRHVAQPTPADLDAQAHVLARQLITMPLSDRDIGLATLKAEAPALHASVVALMTTLRTS